MQHTSNHLERNLILLTDARIIHNIPNLDLYFTKLSNSSYIHSFLRCRIRPKYMRCINFLRRYVLFWTWFPLKDIEKTRLSDAFHSTEYNFHYKDKACQNRKNTVVHLILLITAKAEKSASFLYSIIPNGTTNITSHSF